MATHKTPYGYEMVRGRIVVNVPEAETIRWIFQKRAEGRSVWSIARELYDANDSYFNDSKRKACASGIGAAQCRNERQASRQEVCETILPFGYPDLSDLRRKV